MVSPAAEQLCQELRHTVHARVYADNPGDLVWTKSFIPTVKHLDCLRNFGTHWLDGSSKFSGTRPCSFPDIPTLGDCDHQNFTFPE